MIRQAKPEDINAVAAIAVAAYSIYVARMGRRPAPMDQNFAEAQLLGRLWVYGRAGAIQGYIVAYPQSASFHIENVAVHPDYAGQGIGTKLMAHGEALAVEAGCSSVNLYTNAKMTENLTLYPRLGYVQTDRRIENGFDRVYFVKSLV